MIPPFKQYNETISNYLLKKYTSQGILSRLKSKYLNMPEYATLEDWDKWKEQNMKDHRFLYWLLDEVPFFLKYRIYKNITDFIWKIKHRVIPKHKYHIIRTDLEPGYHDPVEQIPHAIFSIFVEYFETDVPKIDWNATEEHAKVYKEMKEIYDWWKADYPYRDKFTVDLKPMPKYPKYLEDDTEKNTNRKSFKLHRKTSPEHLEIFKQIEQEEERWEQKLNEMCCRIIKIRQYLWY